VSRASCGRFPLFRKGKPSAYHPWHLPSCAPSNLSGSNPGCHRYPRICLQPGWSLDHTTCANSLLTEPPLPGASWTIELEIDKFPWAGFDPPRGISQRWMEKQMGKHR
jgi:hypothetical protein